MKQKELSILLRIVVILCCLVWLVFANWFGRMLGLAVMEPPLLVFWDAWKIFTQIGKNNSFCVENARRLRRISFCALADTVLDVILLVYGVIHRFRFVASFAPDDIMKELGEDLFLAAVRFLFVAIIGVAITVAAAALSHLTLKAAHLQDENDLTI